MGQAIELRYHIHSNDNCPCHSSTTANCGRAGFSGDHANSIGCHGRYGKCSPAAGNWVAFFMMSLSSFRIRTSRRSRSFSRASSRSSAEITSVPRCALTHLFKVEKPTPRSSATWCRESPLVSAIRTAYLRNSFVLPVPMVHLLCCTICDQRSGTKP